MSKFQIEIDSKSETFLREARDGGNILCPIHILVDGMAFPDEHWSDFIVIILGWWLEACIQMKSMGSRVQNDFMDGPFFFTSESANGDVKLAFYQRTMQGSKKMGLEARVPLTEYIGELVRGSQELLNALGSIGYWGGDVNTLRTLMKTLQGSD